MTGDKKSAAMIQKIISGGQTGADRAALDFAIANNIAHGGWVPRGRRAEDGALPPGYRLIETVSNRYAVRTEQNVLAADGTLIVSFGILSHGSLLTKRLAQRHGKPCLWIDRDQGPQDWAVELVRSWIMDNAIGVLNVAGPRASKDHRIYDAVFQLLHSLMKPHGH